MPRKITITDEDGTVTELTDVQYNNLLREAASAILKSPEVESTLQAMVNKYGDELAKRLTDVEKTAAEQGEKIRRVEEKTAKHDEQFRSLGDRSQTLEQEVGALRDKFVAFEAEKGKEIATLNLRLQSALSKDGNSTQPFSSPRPSPLETCPDPSNLKEDFRNLLAIKKRNRMQLVIGPVLSKTDGDGFLDKDNLEPLTEGNVADAIRGIEVEGTFSVTITNAEKRMARVRFEGLYAVESCKRVLAAWKQLRDEFLMWASPDQPVDLSKMTVNAKRFCIALREVGRLPATSYVDVHDGVLFIGAIRIAPVYLIPEKDKWPLINDIVAEQIKNFLSLPWTVRKVRGSSPDMVKQIWDAAWSNVNV
jgi:hypothetical protein